MASMFKPSRIISVLLVAGAAAVELVHPLAQAPSAPWVQTVLFVGAPGEQVEDLVALYLGGADRDVGGNTHPLDLGDRHPHELPGGVPPLACGTGP